MFNFFLDLDGVVCDLLTGIENLTNIKLDRSKYGIDFENSFGMSEKEFWETMSSSNWADLPKMEDADEILELVKPYKPSILSASPKFGIQNCIAGKLRWMEMNIPEYYKDGRWFFGWEKGKIAHEKAVLIDDHEYNTDRWAAAGGLAILVPRPWNKLGRMGFNAVSFITTQLKLVQILEGGPR